MNEPVCLPSLSNSDTLTNLAAQHDLDITTWATTVQASVTAIRSAGATTQKILLPGTDYTSAANFIDNGSGAALKAVKNPDGSTDNLIFDSRPMSRYHANLRIESVSADLLPHDALR